MPFLSENKVFVGVFGIAVSSAAVVYAMSRHGRAQAHSLQTKHSEIVADAAVKYFMEHAIREPLPLIRLREVWGYNSQLQTDFLGYLLASRTGVKLILILD